MLQANTNNLPKGWQENLYAGKSCKIYLKVIFLETDWFDNRFPFKQKECSPASQNQNIGLEKIKL